MIATAQLWWYTARSGGLVAWALVAGSVLWGLALSTKVLNGRQKPNWILDLHRFLGGLSVVFTVVHVLALVLDTYVSFGLLEVLVPFTGDWHPVAVAWGVIGLYLLTAVEITSLLRKRLAKRTWHLLHLLSYPLYALATVHTLTAGSDKGTFLVRALMAVTSVAVVWLTIVRVRSLGRQEEKPRRIPAL